MKKKATGITLDQEVYEKIKEAAKKEERSFSGFLNILLRENPRIGEPLEIKKTAKDIQSYCMRNKMPLIDELEKILKENLIGGN